MNKEYEQDNIENINPDNNLEKQNIVEENSIDENSANENSINESSENESSGNEEIFEHQDGIYSMKQDEIKYNHWKQNNNTYQPQPHQHQNYQNHSYQNQGYRHQGYQDQGHQTHVYQYQGNQHQKPQQMTGKKGIQRLVAFVMAGVLFGVVAGATFQGTNYIARIYFPQIIETVTGNNYDDITENVQIDKENEIVTTPVTAGISSDNDVSHVVENVMPSIVSITSTVTQSYQDFFGNEYDEDAQGSGSGIIVGKNKSELLIITNHHVITDSKSIKVTFINNDILDAKVKGTDQSSDLAVVAVSLDKIKEDTLDKIQVATLGDSDKVKVGQMSIAIGNALGYGQSVTVGYISAKDRKITVDNKNMTLLQTDAAINPGNSGGALLNINGEVIGINSVKYASNEVEGMGYAIPISKAIPIMNELMNKEEIKEGEEGYLGIIGQDVTTEFSGMYNIPLGAYVIEVLKDGASEKAGILPGDIITAINGIEATSMASVKEKVSSYPAGTNIKATIQRRDGAEYKEIIVDVVLEKMDTTQFNKEAEKSKDNNAIPPFGYDIIPE